MLNTGYYALDRLPAKCANAYIFDKQLREYYTNIYSVDVKGTGAGGAFTTVLDVEKFWRSLCEGKLLSRGITEEMLSPQGGENYGYGIWLQKDNNNKFIPYFQGCDPGVSFISLYDKEKEVMITIISNFGNDVWKIEEGIKKEFGGML